MPSLTACHRYVLDRLVDSIGADKSAYLERAVTQERTFQEINDLLQPKGQKKLLFFYQSPAEGDTGWGADKNQPELFISNGESERLRGRCIYFVRVNPKGADARTVDTDLICGEILGSALKTLQVALEDVFAPLLQVRMAAQQAKADDAAPRHAFQVQHKRSATNVIVLAPGLQCSSQIGNYQDI